MKRLILLGIMVLPVSVFAADLYHSEHGKTYYDIIKQKGAPFSKIEYETHRRSIWRYGDEEILFQEGKVVGDAPPKNLPRVVAEAKPVRKVYQDQKVSGDVMNEIINSLPDDSGPTPSSATNPVLQNPEIINAPDESMDK